MGLYHFVGFNQCADRKACAVDPHSILAFLLRGTECQPAAMVKIIVVYCCLCVFVCPLYAKRIPLSVVVNQHNRINVASLKRAPSQKWINQFQGRRELKKNKRCLWLHAGDEDIRPLQFRQARQSALLFRKKGKLLQKNTSR